MFRTRTTARFILAATVAGFGTSVAAGVHVRIDNYGYHPSRITVKPGTKVTWSNEDPVDHTVTADDGAFNSGPLKPGSNYSHLFKLPGTFGYHCNIHPFMKGKVVVRR